MRYAIIGLGYALLLATAAQDDVGKPRIYSDESNLYIEAQDILFQTDNNDANTASVNDFNAGTNNMNQGSEILNNLKEQIRSEVLSSVVEAGSVHNRIEALVSQIRVCSDQNRSLGSNGTCISGELRCPEISVPENMSLQMSPAGLADLRLPGTVAVLTCQDGHVHPTNGTFYCTTQGTWHQEIAPECAGCGLLMDNCTRCAHGECLECAFPYTLHDFLNGTIQCVVPGSVKNVAVRDCDVLRDLGQPTGVYWIKGYVSADKAVQVYCDQDTSGGGWTLLTSFQEQSQANSFAGYSSYATNLGQMWIKGCGNRDSIGCYGKGPDSTRVRREDPGAMRSLDWRAMLERGGDYELRQSIGDCWASLQPANSGWQTCRELDRSDETFDYDNYLDVRYSFRYPGWVMQDDSGGDNVATVTWPLSAATIMSDNTGVSWAASGPNQTTVFYPPYSISNRHTVVNGCYGFDTGLFNSVCSQGVGMAGIINTRSFRNNRSPPGIGMFPYYPRSAANCVAYGPMQGGMQPRGTYCGLTNILGLYWFRKNRSA